MKPKKSTDTHHILWYKRDYSKGWAKRLRDFWYCRVDIPRDTLHRQIHYEISHVPVPRVSSIKAAFVQLEMLEKYGAIKPDDSIEKRLLVMLALFDCIEPKTYEALKKQYYIVCEFYGVYPRI